MSSNIETELDQPSVEGMDSNKEGRLEERDAGSVGQRLEEVDIMLGQLEKFGVNNAEEMAQEKIALEAQFKDRLLELKVKIGDENISQDSEGMIYGHVVDEVVSFREEILNRYQAMLRVKESLTRREGQEPKSREKELPKEQVADQVLNAAKEARTVGDFSDRLALAINEEGGDKNTGLMAAEHNISEIMKGHKKYSVKENLPDTNGVKPAGITEMGPSGGEDVTIDADHLASVGTDEGKIEVNQTLKHEATHQAQTRLNTGAGDTAIIDPTTNREMTELELHEGGAVHATKDLGGQDDTEVADVYDQGLKFYQRNDAEIINEHLNKDGKNAGDRVHLQAELARKAKITDKGTLLKFADKAGFSELETKRFFKLMNEKDTSDNSKMSLAA